MLNDIVWKFPPSIRPEISYALDLTYSTIWKYAIL